MEKIPTIFERDERFKVTPRIKPGCEWVFEGAGEPTEKLDGMNIRLTIRKGLLVRVEKRRGAVHRRELATCVFVPLVGEHGWPPQMP